VLSINLCAVLLQYLPDIKFLADIIDLFISPYININLDLSQQLERLVGLAHVLSELHCVHGGKCWSAQLKSDVIMTVECAFVIVAKLQIKAKSEGKDFDFMTFETGDDRLEEKFGICRTLSHNTSFTINTFAQNVSTAHNLERIWADNPEWHVGKKRQGMGSAEMDRSLSPALWKGNMGVSAVDLKSVWSRGVDLAIKVLHQVNIFQHINRKYFEDKAQKGYTLLRPDGKYFGVSGQDVEVIDGHEPAGEEVLEVLQDVDTADTDAAAQGLTEDALLARVEDQIAYNAQGADEFLPEPPLPSEMSALSEFTSSKHKRFIMVDGQQKDKQSVVRMMNRGIGQLSRERLLAVRGNGRSGGAASLSSCLNDDDMSDGAAVLTVGDPFAVMVNVVLGNGKRGVALAVAMAHGCFERGSAGKQKFSGVSERVLNDGSTTVAYRLLQLTQMKDTTWLALPTKKEVIGKLNGMAITPLNPEVVPVGADGRVMVAVQESSRTDSLLGDGSGGQTPIRFGFQLQDEVLQTVLERCVGGKDIVIESLHTIKSISSSSDVLPYTTATGDFAFVPAGHHPEATEGVTGNATVKCSTCDAVVEVRAMRHHVGFHLLKGHIDSSTMPCGMCGRAGQPSCVLSVRMEGAQKKGPLAGEPVMKVSMAGKCHGYPDEMKAMSWKAAGKMSANSPCTNVPKACRLCSHASSQDVYVWSYNMEAHYHIAHTETATDAVHCVSEDEVQKVISRKDKWVKKSK
jgi:hypothetical protein